MMESLKTRLAKWLDPELAKREFDRACDAWRVEQTHAQRRAEKYWDALEDIENMSTDRASHTVKKMAAHARKARLG